MKISLVTETYPPEVNGVAMTLEHLVHGLVARGHSMEVVRPRQGKGDVAAQSAGMSEFLSIGLPLPGYSGLHFGIIRAGKLVKHWREHRPDLVHVATEGPLGWAAIRAAKKLGIATVSSFHTNFHSYGQHYGYGMLIRTALSWLRYIHNSTRLTFAPSPDVVQTLEKEGFRNMRLLGRGVDTELFDPSRRSEELRKSWGAGPETPVAVYVGRLAGEKNLPVAVQAFKTMRSKIPELRFVLVGDGPSRATLEKENPEFHFAGMRRGEDLATHYASADLFIFASVTETFGNVVTEAMASGLPALAYDYAAPAKYIVNGESGRLAAYGDTEAFIAAAGIMAQEQAHWAEMGRNARKTAEGISWDAVIDGYAEDIRKVLNA
ncbi:MAG: glycosyltransferase family 1 protein [Opitutales bacterium]|nr:glycosyltransferase family 1 protein [Opitutales bacterium]